MRNIPPHRLGVPLLCLWSSIKFTAFSPVIAVSRIVLPILSLRSKLIYGGYTPSARKNAASAYIMIEFSLTSMGCVLINGSIVFFWLWLTRGCYFSISFFQSSSILCKYRILCNDSITHQSISHSLIRWWTYALVYLLSSGEKSQRGEKSSLNCAVLRCLFHCAVNMTPCLPSLVAITQSNISNHCSIAKSKSSGVPTPMR